MAEILYHGSNMYILKPEIRESQAKLDFGKGFYTTRDKRQAEEWCWKKFNKMFDTHMVSGYKYETRVPLNMCVFNSINESWAEFVYRSKYQHKKHKYDIVQGPCICGEALGYMRNQTDYRKVPDFKLVAQLAHRSPKCNQMAFCTDKAIQCLTYSPAHSYSLDTQSKKFSAECSQRLLNTIEDILQHLVKHAVDFHQQKYGVSELDFLAWLYQSEIYKKLTSINAELWGEPRDAQLMCIEHEYLTGDCLW